MQRIFCLINQCMQAGDWRILYTPDQQVWPTNLYQVMKDTQQTRLQLLARPQVAVLSKPSSAASSSSNSNSSSKARASSAQRPTQQARPGQAALPGPAAEAQALLALAEVLGGLSKQGTNGAKSDYSSKISNGSRIASAVSSQTVAASNTPNTQHNITAGQYGVDCKSLAVTGNILDAAGCNGQSPTAHQVASAAHVQPATHASGLEQLANGMGQAVSAAAAAAAAAAAVTAMVADSAKQAVALLAVW
jgi:hypothetical protein